MFIGRHRFRPDRFSVHVIFRVVEAAGFEPTTSRFQSESSARLSYTSIDGRMEQLISGAGNHTARRPHPAGSDQRMRPDAVLGSEALECSNASTLQRFNASPADCTPASLARRPTLSRGAHFFSGNPPGDPGRIRTCVWWVAATCLAARPRDHMVWVDASDSNRYGLHSQCSALPIEPAPTQSGGAGGICTLSSGDYYATAPLQGNGI